jgi:hypothetical protein
MADELSAQERMKRYGNGIQKAAERLASRCGGIKDRSGWRCTAPMAAESSVPGLMEPCGSGSQFGATPSAWSAFPCGSSRSWRSLSPMRSKKPSAPASAGGGPEHPFLRGALRLNERVYILGTLSLERLARNARRRHRELGVPVHTMGASNSRRAMEPFQLLTGLRKGIDGGDRSIAWPNPTTAGLWML